MKWGRIAVWIAGIALAVGLFPTLRAMVKGSSSEPELTVSPTTASHASRLAAELAVKAARPGSERVVLAGNSVATELGLGFKAIPSTALLNLGNPGCTFPTSVTAIYHNPFTLQTVSSSPCPAQRELVPLRIFRPNVVFWLVNDAPPPWRYHGRTLRACAEPYESLYARDLRAEIGYLQDTGATVVITTEAYVRGEATDIVALSDATVDCNNRIRRQVAAQTGATLADLAGFTCPHGHCTDARDGVTLRPDGLHYTGPGGDLVAQWLFDQSQRSS